MSHKKLTLLGVMTGTSCDGLDASWMGWTPNGIRFEKFASTPFPDSLRKRVLAAQKPGFKTSLRDHLKLERDLGVWYGKTIQRLIQKHSADVIALHGQTVSHFPDDFTTLQMGNPAIVAQMTGKTVISDFRSGDLATGGQGAPLVPKFHVWIAEQESSFKQTKKNPGGIAIHNLGGISNLTAIFPSKRIVAYDTGPANIWIDAAIKRISRGKKLYDRDGKVAAQGVAHLPTVAQFLKHPFFKKTPPKSTGRDDFSVSDFMDHCKLLGADLVATATEISAQSIANEYSRLNRSKKTRIEKIYFCGGGARNAFLISRIQALIPEVEMTSIESLGIDPQSIESAAFAYLGALTLDGQTLTGNWTGARGFAPPGQITPGKNWQKITETLPKLYRN